MKNIQIFDGAENAVYDIFAATDEEFALIFPNGTDVAFIDEVYQKQPTKMLDAAFTEIWRRRVPKREAMGIHGMLFYECEHALSQAQSLASCLFEITSSATASAAFSMR